MTLPLLQVPTMEQDVQHKGILAQGKGREQWLGRQDLCLESNRECQQAGFGGGSSQAWLFSPSLCGDGVSLGQHVEIGDRSRCLCCTELPSQFPGHFAGAGQGDPSRNHMEDNPNSAEHVDWVSVDFQSGCRRTMAL